MFHFPSTLQQGSSNNFRRSEGINLNATQQKSATHPIFVKVEEELHDARRVHADGQEDDLRYALSMVINRVTELSSLLSESYKAQAELEVQLNVARSNLKLVIANNEMLEDAIRQNMSAQSKDVGWNRTNRRSSAESKDPRGNLERSQSVDIPNPSHSEPITPPSTGVPISTTPNAPQDNRFFKFRFSTSRPSTPSGQTSSSPNASHLTSPSLPSLSSVKTKEIEDLTAELQKERAGRKKISEAKAALEAELESLSQALFEEANKMVADERRLRADAEEELKELRMEKEALHSALRLVAGEYNAMPPAVANQEEEQPENKPSTSRTLHSRRSSQIKSRPHSLELASTYPLPPSPASDSAELSPWYHEEEERSSPKENDLPIIKMVSPGEESHSTPRVQASNLATADDPFNEASPWADVPSSSTLGSRISSPTKPMHVTTAPSTLQ